MVIHDDDVARGAHGAASPAAGSGFVGQPGPQTFGRGDAASNEPHAAEGRPEAPVHELREITRVELDGFPDPRQFATGEDEGGLVAVRPSQPLASKLNAVSWVRDPMTQQSIVFRKLSTNPGARMSPPANSSDVSSHSTRPSLRAMKASRLAAM